MANIHCFCAIGQHCGNVFTTLIESQTLTEDEIWKWVMSANNGEEELDGAGSGR